MSFQSAFSQSPSHISGPGKVLGENGMPDEATTTNGLLDASSSLVRGITVENINKHLDGIFNTGDIVQIANSFVLLFQKRNCRGGEGEKKFVYEAFLIFWNRYPETCLGVIDSDLFGIYGCYKDYFQIWQYICSLRENMRQQEWIGKYGKLVRRIVANIAKLRADTIDRVTNKKENPMENALVCKWVPSENSMYDKSCYFYDKNTNMVSAVEYLCIGHEVVCGRQQLSSNDARYRSYINRLKKAYREGNTLVRKELDIPEKHMCANEWAQIKLNKLCSRFMTKCQKALMNKNKNGTQRSDDPSRVELASRLKVFMLEKGLKGAQLFPHELLKKMYGVRNDKDQYDFFFSQWNDLKNTTCYRICNTMMESIVDNKGEDILKMLVNFMPIADVSGSMSGTPMDVSIGLTVFFSDFTHLLIDVLRSFADFVDDESVWGVEDVSSSVKKSTYYKNTVNSVMRGIIDSLVKNELSFLSRKIFVECIRKINKDNYLTNHAISFTERPSLFTFKDTEGPIDRQMKLEHNVGYTTNFQLAIGVLLDTCVRHNVPAEAIPTLIVFTDGQFDQMNISSGINTGSIWSYNRCHAPSWQTCHQTIMSDFSKAGYDRIPDFVYWNLRANTSGFKTTASHPGVQMLSGYSPAMMNSIMLGQLGGEEEIEVIVDGVKKVMKVSKTNPIDTLMKTLGSKDYDPVRAVLFDSNEGILAKYTPDNFV